MVTPASLVYAMEVDTVMQVYDCTLLDDGSYSLDASPAFRCYTPEWQFLVWVSIVPIVIFLIGIPLTFVRRGGLTIGRTVLHPH